MAWIGSTAGIRRPTPPPFDWARDLLSYGVTGTNGKTSTTHLLAAVLRQSHGSAFSGTTLGYHLDDAVLDVPLDTNGFYAALRSAHSHGCRAAALEVTAQALAGGFAGMWRFDAGVFTNLSRDHLDFHTSWESYLAAKAQLFMHLGPGSVAVLNAADPVFPTLAQAVPDDVQRFGFARSVTRMPDVSTLCARHIDYDLDGTAIDLEPGPIADQLGGSLRIAFVGEAYAENALAAATVAAATGIDGSAIRRGLARARVLPGRFEIVQRAPLVVVDFAHTPAALEQLCLTARRLAPRGRLIVVFGAGGNRDPSKRTLMGETVGRLADVAIVTNDNPRQEDPSHIAHQIEQGLATGGSATVHRDLDRRRAIERALNQATSADMVVVAGRGHETVQRIGSDEKAFSDAEVTRELLGLASSRATQQNGDEEPGDR